MSIIFPLTLYFCLTNAVYKARGNKHLLAYEPTQLTVDHPTRYLVACN